MPKRERALWRPCRNETGWFCLLRIVVLPLAIVLAIAEQIRQNRLCPPFGPRRIRDRDAESGEMSWCEERKIQPIHIQPGRPMQNDHVESFNGRLYSSWAN